MIVYSTIFVRSRRIINPINGFSSGTKSLPTPDKEPIWTADIFRDIKGFRVDVRSTRYGLVRIPVTTFPSGCITSLVDGYPASPARPVPESPYDLIAVEAYARADSVPREYQRYTWPSRGDVTRSGRCSVIAYWTLRARVK